MNFEGQYWKIQPLVFDESYTKRKLIHSGFQNTKIHNLKLHGSKVMAWWTSAKILKFLESNFSFTTANFGWIFRKIKPLEFKDCWTKTKMKLPGFQKARILDFSLFGSKDMTRWTHRKTNPSNFQKWIFQFWFNDFSLNTQPNAVKPIRKCEWRFKGVPDLIWGNLV